MIPYNVVEKFDYLKQMKKILPEYLLFFEKCEKEFRMALLNTTGEFD